MWLNVSCLYRRRFGTTTVRCASARRTPPSRRLHEAAGGAGDTISVLAYELGNPQ